MSAAQPTGISEAARRYASALFELAQDKGALEEVNTGLKALGEAVRESAELKSFLAAPLFKLEDKASALTAITDKMGLAPLVRNFVGTLALNGRARELPGAIAAFDELYVNQRGIKRAIVRTAQPMKDAQIERLEGLLSNTVGGEFDLRSEVDADLIGGIQLKIGSQLVDASLKAKLERLNTAMKGA